MKSSAYQWPTCEEWARTRRTLYDGWAESLAIDFHLETSEKAEATAALRALWKTEGARMRALHIPKELKRQQGETRSAYSQRYLAMSQEEQDLLLAATELRYARNQINSALKALEHNYQQTFFKYKEIRPAIPRLVARYEAAIKAAEEKRRREILTRPIDDKASARTAIA